jgi:asparagine synthase (glutamine-hydrolysing)
MCGFVGVFDRRRGEAADPALLRRMAGRLVHRGPDSEGYFAEGPVGLGFRRLAIIDPAGGDQPLYSEDGSVVLVCNGEVYNHRELRQGLERRGHRFATGSDVEVIVHLYEEEGERLLGRLNGQFAFALYDRHRRRLLLARDQFGVNPLYYAEQGEAVLFASEVKAILEHPLAPRRVDLTGLDQVLSLPGLVSPRTMFGGVSSFQPGHYMDIEGGRARDVEYWDLDYPLAEPAEPAQARPESYYVEGLRELLERSVRYRLQADVPVGFYLSGGLDSSLVAATAGRLTPGERHHSFSIRFDDPAICESKYQRLMAARLNSRHHESTFTWDEILGRMEDMIRHAECPVKETFNTCSLALSEAAREAGVKVVLAGEGADELFAGYVGYRFDQSGIRGRAGGDLEAALEGEMRERLWGDPNLFYELDHYAWRDARSALYSEGVNALFPEFEYANFGLVNTERLRGRHFLHQRSYLDFKLRLADHLLADHGDRMALANSVEARYPFLDIDLVEFARLIPPSLKLNGFTEKYIVKKLAQGVLPPEIVGREKFGFRAPGSPYLLRQNQEWFNDLLSHERIRRQGYFNPDAVDRLKRQYTREDFNIHPHNEIDLLMVVLSFGIFLDLFGMPSLN